MKKVVSVILVVCVMMLTAATAEGWKIASGGNSNVRACPNINGEIIDVIMEGEVIYSFNEIHTKDGRTWCQVDWDGQDAYISDRYLSDWYGETDCLDDKNYSSFITEREFVITRNIKAFQWADLDADIGGSYTRGTHVWGSHLYTGEDGTVFLEVRNSNQYDYIPLQNVRHVNGKQQEMYMFTLTLT